jgi:hypothetical protein
VARTHISSTAQGVFSLTSLIYYKAGWEDALSSGTRVAESESAKELSSTISELHSSNPLVSQGAFHDDPTWDGFMKSIEEYRDQSDAFERSLE